MAMIFDTNGTNRTRIVYDYQAFDMQRFGGISRYFCEIIKRLGMPKDIGVRYSTNYYLTSYHLGRHRLPIPRFIFKRNPEYFHRQNRLLSERLLSKDGDIIFHPTYYDPYFLERIGNNPYVVTVHDMIHEKFPDSFVDAEVMSRNKQIVIKNASRIIAISQNTKNDIIELLGINADKIDVIYHGTSMDGHIKPHRLTLPQKYLLYVGDRTKYKNFNRFIKAFASISHTYHDLYVICTAPLLKDSEIKMIDELGLKDRVTSMKVNDRDLAELYARAEMFVYPSLYEGFGIPILEAFSCQCPVALSNTSCFPEIADNAGLYFDPYSETSIADAIITLLEDKQVCKELIKRGNDRLKHYSWERASRQTETVYREIISNG